MDVKLFYHSDYPVVDDNAGLPLGFFGLLCAFDLLDLEFFYDALTTAFIILF